VLLAAIGVPTVAGAQGSQPLQKTDLIRILASPMIGKQELAELIRRNCLAFRPTQRDRADLRALGADEMIMSRVEECGARTRTRSAAPAPAAPRVVERRDALPHPAADSARPAAVTPAPGAAAARPETALVSEPARAAVPPKAEPGAAVAIEIERSGVRVDGGRIRVELGVPFSLTLTGRDTSGNPVATASLMGRFEEQRGLLELLGVEPRALATVLTFKPVQVGVTDVVISVGVAAKVVVEVIRSDR
jgi:hypothetical protein